MEICRLVLPPGTAEAKLTVIFRITRSYIYAVDMTERDFSSANHFTLKTSNTARIPAF